MNKQLDILRVYINKLDHQIIKLLAKRLQIVQRVGRFKKQRNIPALDSKRWQEVLETRIKLGKSLGISERLVKKIYEAIHEEALKIENHL